MVLASQSMAPAQKVVDERMMGRNHPNQPRRGNLQQRIDVLRFVYEGAVSRSEIMRDAGLGYEVTKTIVQSLIAKRYLKLAYANRDSKSKPKNHPDQIGNRKWSRLHIVITMDGLRVLLSARTLSRQLLDEEIDWK